MHPTSLRIFLVSRLHWSGLGRNDSDTGLRRALPRYFPPSVPSLQLTAYLTSPESVFLLSFFLCFSTLIFATGFSFSLSSFPFCLRAFLFSFFLLFPTFYFLQFLHLFLLYFLPCTFMLLHSHFLPFLRLCFPFPFCLQSPSLKFPIISSTSSLLHFFPFSITPFSHFLYLPLLLSAYGSLSLLLYTIFLIHTSPSLPRSSANSSPSLPLSIPSFNFFSQTHSPSLLLNPPLPLLLLAFLPLPSFPFLACPSPAKVQEQFLASVPPAHPKSQAVTATAHRLQATPCPLRSTETVEASAHVPNDDSLPVMLLRVIIETVTLRTAKSAK